MPILRLAMSLAASFLIVVCYHTFYVKERLSQNVAERGYYILDVKQLTALRAAEIALAAKKGESSAPDQAALLQNFSDFNQQLRAALDALVGGAPVFLPNTVVSVENFIDLTPDVAAMMNIDLHADLSSIFPPQNVSPDDLSPNFHPDFSKELPQPGEHRQGSNPDNGESSTLQDTSYLRN